MSHSRVHCRVQRKVRWESDLPFIRELGDCWRRTRNPFLALCPDSIGPCKAGPGYHTSDDIRLQGNYWLFDPYLPRRNVWTLETADLTMCCSFQNGDSRAAVQGKLVGINFRMP